MALRPDRSPRSRTAASASTAPFSGMARGWPCGEPVLLLDAGFLATRVALARFDPGDAFPWIAELRRSNSVTFPAYGGRLAGRSAGSRRRQAGTAAGAAAVRSAGDRAAAVGDARPYRRAVRGRLPRHARRGSAFRLRRHVRRAGRSAGRLRRRPSPSDSPGSAARAAGVQPPAAARIPAGLGLLRQQADAQHSSRSTSRAPCGRSSPKDGGSRPKGGCSAPRATCRCACRPAWTGSSSTRGVDFGDDVSANLQDLLAALRSGRRHGPARRRDTRAGAGGVAEALRGRRADSARRKAITSASGRRRRRCSTRCSRASRRSRWTRRSSRAREALKSFSGIAPLDPPASFTGTLRDYQRDALGWFAFLREFGFGGCLADDMGLGKTVMVHRAARVRGGSRSRPTGARPSLAVLPRSLVFNWMEEARALCARAHASSTATGATRDLSPGRRATISCSRPTAR